MMKELREDRELKLPRWAQDKLARQRHEIRELESQVATLTGKQQGISYFNKPWGIGHEPLPLGPTPMGLECNIPMSQTPNQSWDARLMVKANRLEVMVTSWHGLSITPQASNVIVLGPSRTH